MRGTVDKDTFIAWRRSDAESATLFHEWVNARLKTVICEPGVTLHAVNVHVDEHTCKIDALATKPTPEGAHAPIDQMNGRALLRSYHFVIFGNPPPTWPPGAKSG
jgi:hypothetical protein